MKEQGQYLGRMTRDEAQVVIAEINNEQGSDETLWRLPTKKECREGRFIPPLSGTYWTYEPGSMGSNIDFCDGRVVGYGSTGIKDLKFHVCLVR